MTQVPNVVIGGGLYGCMIAIMLAERGERVVLLERERDLLGHASYNNQARVHGGYHYPRDRVTGRRSVANIKRFEREFGFSVTRPAPTLYAIARQGSKVTPQQFEEFCADIGTPLYQASQDQLSLFDSQMIAAAYRVEEPVFDSALIRSHMKQRIATLPIEIRLGHQAISCFRQDAGVTLLASTKGDVHAMEAARVFNCSYSGLCTLDVHRSPLKTRLKHEITEMALIEMPAQLEDIGVTVMDGDFWSSLPFPDRKAHTLSHVGYTPHLSWEEDDKTHPYDLLEIYKRQTPSRGSRMILDAARYVPALRDARQVDSLWEVKTVLVKNETNDGRPILLEKHDDIPVWSVLGGKVDNIFDLLDRIETDILHSTPAALSA